jgi:hypothetical protein
MPIGNRNMNSMEFGLMQLSALSPDVKSQYSGLVDLRAKILEQLERLGINPNEQPYILLMDEVIAKILAEKMLPKNIEQLTLIWKKKLISLNKKGNHERIEETEE